MNGPSLNNHSALRSTVHHGSQVVYSLYSVISSVTDGRLGSRRISSIAGAKQDNKIESDRPGEMNSQVVNIMLRSG